MKSKILLSLLGVSFAIPVLAQSSGVAIYGIADVGFQVSSFGSGTRKTSLASGIADGSRLGFKGAEDLSAGYKAIFNLESRIEFDTGSQSPGYLGTSTAKALTTGLPAPVATALGPTLQPAKAVNPSGAPYDRTSLVGLITPVGGILMGRQYTPGYEVFAMSDTFESGTAGSWGNIAGGTGGLAATPGIAIRANQALQYKVQLPNGLAGSIMYAKENTGSLNLAQRFWGANVKYQADGWNIGLAYNAEYDQGGKDSLKSLVLGGSYVMGKAKLFGGYLRMRNDNSVLVAPLTPVIGPVFAATVGSNARIDGQTLTLGMQYRLNKGRLMAAVSRTNDKLATNSDATLYGLGYFHDVSKRTDLYMVVSYVSNQNTGQYALGGAGYPGGFTSQPGQSGKAFQTGIRHKF